MANKPEARDPVLASNRQASHNYQILERYEAGVRLSGTEVKSCRDRAIQMQDAYCRIQNGEAWMMNCQIATYAQGNRYNHEPKGMRKLLLHRNQILKLKQMVGEKGGTIIPLKMYLKGGLIKVEIAYCQGKTHGDKRDALRKKQDELEVRRRVRR